jgi:hypothetical protein
MIKKSTINMAWNPPRRSKMHQNGPKCTKMGSSRPRCGTSHQCGQSKIEQAHLDRQERFGHGLGSDTSTNKIQENGGDEPHKRAGADSINIDGKFNEHKAMDTRSSVTDNESTSDNEDGLISNLTMKIT